MLRVEGLTTGYSAIPVLNGISIKVGPGATNATYRSSGTAEFLDWLRQLPAQLAG